MYTDFFKRFDLKVWLDWINTGFWVYIIGKGVVAYITSFLVVIMLDVTTELENCIPEQMFGNSVSCWHTMFKSTGDFIYWESLQSKLQKFWFFVM